MTSILNLQEYGSDSSSDDEFVENVTQHLKPINSEYSVSKEIQLTVAPAVTSLVSIVVVAIAVILISQYSFLELDFSFF